MLIQRGIKIKQHRMNGWEMSPSKHGKGFPPDESNGVRRGKQSWGRGGGGWPRKRGGKEGGGGMGERVGVSEFNPGKGKQGGGEKGEVGVPPALGKSCPGTGRGRARRRTHSWVEPKSLFFRKEAHCGHPGSLRNPSGRTDLRVHPPATTTVPGSGGSVLGSLVRCSSHLEILPHFQTRGPHFHFATANYVAGPG